MAVDPSLPGLRSCMSCGKKFLSADVERIRRCNVCKRKEVRDGHVPRQGRMSDVRGAIRHHFRRS